MVRGRWGPKGAEVVHSGDESRRGSPSLAQVQLLVTASVESFRMQLENSEDPLTLEDMPRFGASELGVRGLSVPATMLAGRDAAALERLRDEGDKARCPMLLLQEVEPLGLASPDPATRQAAIERIGRLARAANMLGCAHLGVSLGGEDADDAFELAATTFRDVMQQIDRYDVGLLIEAKPGLAESPERLTDLIKKIGGFRIGSLPDFRFAHDSGDFTGTLRRLAPYAGTILARVGKSADRKPATMKSDKTPYDLTEGLEAILAVGYQHAICLDHAGGPGALAAIVAAREAIEAALTVKTETELVEGGDSAAEEISAEETPTDETSAEETPAEDVES